MFNCDEKKPEKPDRDLQQDVREVKPPYPHTKAVGLTYGIAGHRPAESGSRPAERVLA